MSLGDSSWTKGEAHSILLKCMAQRASLGLSSSAKTSKGTVDSTCQLPPRPLLLQQELLTDLETRMFSPQSHHPYRPVLRLALLFPSLLLSLSTPSLSPPFFLFAVSLPLFWFLQHRHF